MGERGLGYLLGVNGIRGHIFGTLGVNLPLFTPSSNTPIYHKMVQLDESA
jgi:hypothetical protein